MRRARKMEERAGFEPAVPFGTSDFKSDALDQTQPSLRKFRDNKIVPPSLIICLIKSLSLSQLLLSQVFSFEFRPKMEPSIGFEPTISALQKRRFTIKLQGRKMCYRKMVGACGFDPLPLARVRFYRPGAETISFKRRIKWWTNSDLNRKPTV